MARSSSCPASPAWSSPRCCSTSRWSSAPSSTPPSTEPPRGSAPSAPNFGTALPMSTHTRRDLDAWIPRLLAVYRQARKMPGGPESRLQPDELREAAAAVRKLSQGLTRERELAGASYMDDPKL